MLRKYIKYVPPRTRVKIYNDSQDTASVAIILDARGAARGAGGERYGAPATVLFWTFSCYPGLILTVYNIKSV